MKRVVLDLDGVFANFQDPFHLVMAQHGAVLKPLADPNLDPSCWDYFELYGATKEQSRAAWNYVSKNHSWWEDLPVHRNVQQWTLQQLFRLQTTQEVTFVTCRPSARVYTLNWVQRELFPDYDCRPQVIVVPKDKVPALIAMEPHYIVEDKHETLRQYHLQSKNKATLILVDRPYNRGFDNTGLTVVGSTEEALRIIP